MTEDDVRVRIAEILRVPEARVQPGTALTDLVAESFQLVEMVIELQEDYDIVLSSEDLRDLRTVGQLTELVVSRLPPGPLHSSG